MSGISWADVDGRLVRRVTTRWAGQSLTLTNNEPFGAGMQLWLVDLEGWYGGVDLVGESVQRALGHGLFPTPSRRTGRVLTLEGLLQLESEADRTVAERYLSGLLGDGELGEITYSVSEGPELTAQVKLDGPVKITPIGFDMVKFQAPLLAPDPFLYGDTQEATLNIPGAGEGLKWGPGIVKGGYMRWGGSVPPARLSNAGNADSWPVFEVRGVFPEGFTLTMNQQTIEFTGLVTTKAPVVVDTGAGQITQRGRDVTHLLARRQWAPIPPRSTLTPRLAARSRLSEGWAVARWADTYI